MTILETAKALLEMGIAVIPVKYRAKRPVVDWKPYQTQLPAPEDVLAWFGGRLINLGIVTGWQGLTVLDFDEAEAYSRWLLWAKRSGGVAGMVARLAFRVRTSRGVHVYIRLPEAVRNRRLEGGIDIKSRGGYVLGPGSVHPNGALYEPLSESWIFPFVSSLDVVLPPALLVRQQGEQSQAVQHPQVLRANLDDDPWAAAVSRPVGDDTTGLVARIKARVRIEDFFPDAQQTGAGWYLARCPLHDDDHPSFWFNTEHQIGGCFAGCTTKPVDVINLFARIYGLSNRTAIFMLAGREDVKGV